MDRSFSVHALGLDFVLTPSFVSLQGEGHRCQSGYLSMGFR